MTFAGRIKSWIMNKHLYQVEEQNRESETTVGIKILKIHKQKFYTVICSFRVTTLESTF